MTHLMNAPRYIFNITVLLAFLIGAPLATAKHIIVIYDVSGSMIRLRIDGHLYTYMESEDIRRINDYLTHLLFIDTAQQPLRNSDDLLIKECEPAYVGKPLYQRGDILTYADYADQRYERIHRGQVLREEFQGKLPRPLNLESAFHGKFSHLLRAKMEVYDELYNDADDATYWVFVSDEDTDTSNKSTRGIASVEKRLAEIEEEYYSPMIFGIIVNDHVKIKVRRLQKRVDIDSIVLGTLHKPNDEVREIQFSKENERQFISEILTLDTINPVKSKFKLNKVNIEMIDRYSRPVQIVNKDNTVDVFEIPSIPLHGKRPPAEFQIRFPVSPGIFAPGNTLKLEVPYSYNGVDREPYSPLPLGYTAMIDSIYASDLDNSEQPVKQLQLDFSEGTYRGDLAIQSESPNKEAFQINHVRCHIQYEDGRKLCEATVAPAVLSLGAPFRVEVPKVSRLDWHGNRLLLDISYEYDGVTKSATLGIPFELQGGESGFPIWVLWLLLIPLLVVIGIFLIRFIKQDQIEYRIALTEVNAADMPVGETKTFILTEGKTLEFGAGGDEALRFDVGSSAVLYNVKRNILLFTDAHDNEGQNVEPPETLTLKRGEEDTVYVRCEIAPEASDELPPDDEPIGNADSSDDNPLAT